MKQGYHNTKFYLNQELEIKNGFFKGKIFVIRDFSPLTQRYCGHFKKEITSHWFSTKELDAMTKTNNQCSFSKCSQCAGKLFLEG